MADDLKSRRDAMTQSHIERMKGPRPRGCSVIVEGRVVPKLTMLEQGDRIDFILDGRLCFDFPKELACHAAAFAAAAMAIGAGYPSFTFCDAKAPFAPRCTELSEPPR